MGFLLWLRPVNPNNCNSYALRYRLRFRKLTYVGGFDLSFCKSDSSVACCTVVVCDVSQQLQVVYEDSRQVKLTIPYIPGDFTPHKNSVPNEN